MSQRGGRGRHDSDDDLWGDDRASARKHKSSKSKKKAKRPRDGDELGGARPKPRMRTADDVIKRIKYGVLVLLVLCTHALCLRGLASMAMVSCGGSCVCVCARRCSWDPYLDKEEFTVGYLDRFVGLKEKPFSQFVWYVCSRSQALAAESALPYPPVHPRPPLNHRRRNDLYNVEQWDSTVLQHRIEYFKWRDIKVWDKPTRTDRVFGSSGVDPAHGGSGEPLLADLVAAADGPWTRPAAAGSQADDSEDKGASRGSARPAGDADRPTHFLCIRVSGKTVRKRVGVVQAHVLDADNRLGGAILPPARLHITLATVRCTRDEKLAVVTQVLNEMHDDGTLDECFPPDSRLVFDDGLECFRERVLVAKPAPHAGLHRFQHELLRRLGERGAWCVV